MDATKERLRRFLVDEGHWYAEPEKLGDDLPIISTILDSVGLVNLVAMVEDEFGVEVRDEDLDFENFGTIARIAAYADGARSAARSEAPDRALRSPAPLAERLARVLRELQRRLRPAPSSPSLRRAP